MRKQDFHHHHHHQVPGLLQTSAIMAFQSSLSSVLLMSSLLGKSFLVKMIFRLSLYFLRCLPLLLVPQIFPLNICFSIPSALFICPKNCSCLFLMVLSRDLYLDSILLYVPALMQTMVIIQFVSSRLISLNS